MTDKTALLGDEALGKKMVKKSFWLYFFTFLILPTGYLVKVMASQSLSVEDVGLLYTIISFIGILSSYNDLGLTNALVYFIPKYRIEKQYNKITTVLFSASTVQFITTVGICLFLWFGGERLATVYFKNPEATVLLKRFVFYFIGINAFQLITAVFRSFQDVTNEKLMETIKMRSITLFALWVFFFSGDPSVAGFGTARVAGMGLGVLLGIILFSTKYGFILKYQPERSKGVLKKFGKYSLYTFLAMNAGVLFSQIDQQMVNFFLGNEMAGYYTNFVSLHGIATLTLSPLGIFIYPLLTELLTKKDISGVRKIIELYYHQLLLVLLSACAFLFVFGPEISLLLFGEGWAFSGELLRWYTPFIAFIFMNAVHLGILRANGDANSNVKILWGGLILNVIINYFGIKFFGIYGAILGLVISGIFMRLFSYIKLSNITKRNINKNFRTKNCILLTILFSLSRILFGKEIIQENVILLIVLTGIIWLISIATINLSEIKKVKKVLKNF